VAIKHLVPALAVSLLAACASYTPATTMQEAPTGNEAYIYGNFKIYSPNSALAFDGYGTMGLDLECDDGKAYRVRFNRDQPLQVVKVAPATCALKKIIFSNADGQKTGSNDMPAEIQKPRQFLAGHAYYLGDYVAQNTYKDKMIYWNLLSARDHYDKTTKAFQAAYGLLSTLPTEDQVLLLK